MAMELETRRIDADKIKELVKKDTNVVFEYVHDTPDGSMDPEQQASVLRDITVAFDAGCRANKTMCDEAIRETIMRRRKPFRKFQRFYPLVFGSVTKRVTTADAKEQLDKFRKLAMLFIVERWKGEGGEDDKHARAMHTALRISMRDKREGDADETTAKADLPEGVTITPMHVSEFGDCTVNQD
jgi:hypothetical protein